MVRQAMVVLGLATLAYVILVPAVHDVLKRTSSMDALLMGVFVSHFGFGDILISLIGNFLNL